MYYTRVLSPNIIVTKIKLVYGYFYEYDGKRQKAFVYARSFNAKRIFIWYYNVPQNYVDDWEALNTTCTLKRKGVIYENV